MEGKSRTSTVQQDQDSKDPVITPADNPSRNMPDELIVEILARLPARSLLRFRCVCQSWRSLISDPQFVKKHLCLSNVDPNFTHHRILVRKVPDHVSTPITIPDPGDINSYSLYAIFNDICDRKMQLLDAPPPFSNPRCKIEGSCNGLVCLRIMNERVIYIWNPSTGESKPLPHVIPCSCSLGFGYDESTDDYKVVILCQSNIGDPRICKADVCSLRTGSRREIQNFPCSWPLCAWSVFVNGALYWVVVSAIEVPTRWDLVALDLSTETYQEVPQPNYIDESFSLLDHGILDFGFYLEFVVVQGSLCLACHYICHCSASHTALWIMEGYGMRGSWTKLLKIPYPQELDEGQKFRRLLSFSRDGKFLMATKNLLVLYSSKEDRFQYLPTHGWELLGDDIFEVKTCVDSLISPNPTKDNEQ